MLRANVVAAGVRAGEEGGSLPTYRANLDSRPLPPLSSFISARAPIRTAPARLLRLTPGYGRQNLCSPLSAGHIATRIRARMCGHARGRGELCLAHPLSPLFPLLPLLITLPPACARIRGLKETCGGPFLAPSPL